MYTRIVLLVSHIVIEKESNIAKKCIETVLFVVPLIITDDYRCNKFDKAVMRYKPENVATCNFSNVDNEISFYIIST